jgi:hypothetical protein
VKLQTLRDKVLIALFLSAAFLLPLGVEAKAPTLVPRQNKTKAVFRLVAREEPLPTNTVANTEMFVAEMVEHQEQQANSKLVRLVFRSTNLGATLYGSNFDYSLLHTFRALRDESCDQTYKAVSTKYLFLSPWQYLGSANALEPAAGAPQISTSDDTVLPCYVITPSDYRGTKTLRAAE